jgi:hypothetical protein
VCAKQETEEKSEQPTERMFSVSVLQKPEQFSVQSFGFKPVLAVVQSFGFKPVLAATKRPSLVKNRNKKPKKESKNITTNRKNVFSFQFRFCRSQSFSFQFRFCRSQNTVFGSEFRFQASTGCDQATKGQCILKLAATKNRLGAPYFLNGPRPRVNATCNLKPTRGAIFFEWSFFDIKGNCRGPPFGRESNVSAGYV